MSILHCICVVMFCSTMQYISTEVSMTTVTQPEHHVQTKNCSFKKGDQKQKNNGDIIRINASNCELVTIHKFICTLCSVTQNMLLNVSWNRIRVLDEVECNCPGIAELDVSDNELSVLQANSFTFVQYVRRIYMAGNHIYNIDDRVFGGLRMLQLLDLSRNALRGIRLNVFNGLSNLRQLNLSENQIQHIVSSGFTGLESLEDLDLSRNNIYSIGSESFTTIENLRFLDLSENRLWNPKLDFLSAFLNLSIINLSRNNFTSFGYGSLTGFHINEIILSDLKGLRYILAGAFQNSDFLKELDLSRNKMLVFIEDFAIQNVPNLTTFDVSYTSLQALPIVSDEVNFKTIDTPVKCGCISKRGDCFNNSSSKAGQVADECGPVIVSQIAKNYFLYVGQSLNLDCFAVGFPRPRVIWERLQLFPNGTISVLEVLANGHFLNLKLSALNMEGKYRCEAESHGEKVQKYFKLNVLHINVGIWVLSQNTHSVLVAWNKTLQTQRHVLLYRAYEKTSNYVIQRLNEFWKVFIVRSLTPFTEYEICIASFSDINDKTCVRTMTSRQVKETTVGIRHNNLAIAFLVISGIIFGVFVLTTVYKCVHKVRIITKRNVFVVGSESRECFADVTESTFTYENQHTELLIDKTEL